MNKKNLIFITLILTILIVPIAFAGFFSDFKNLITGRVAQGNITVGINLTGVNNGPIIYYVTPNLQPLPSENSTVNVDFTFSVNDSDLCGNIDTTSGRGIVQLNGVTRSNLSCTASACNDAYSLNFTCTVQMWYFDNSTAWTINVSAADINANRTENTSITLTPQQITTIGGINMSLNFTGVTIGATNFKSNNNITIYNIGNKPLAVKINATDLQGQGVDTSQFIYASNFSMNTTSALACSGTTLANATQTTLVGVTANFGNNTAGQGITPIVTCLRDVPATLKSQNYVSPLVWDLRVI